jgi:chloramphenicol-sensitive protein RarD
VASNEPGAVAPNEAGAHDRLGLTCGVAAYGIWGLLTLYWHALTGVSALELIGLRILAASAVLIVLLAIRGGGSRVRAALADRRLLRRIVAAALLLATNWTTYVWCVTHGRVVETALGYFIAPLGTVIIGVVALGERLRRAHIMALGLATAAVIVLTIDYGQVPVLALVLASSWSVYGWLKKLVPLGPLESLSAETFVLAPAAVVVVTVFEARGDGAFATAPGGQLALLTFAGVVTVVPLLLFAAAAQRLPLTVLGPLQYMVPIINFVLGIVVYREPLPFLGYVGFALVWAALAIFTVDTIRVARRARLDGVDGPVPLEAEPVSPA